MDLEEDNDGDDTENETGTITFVEYINDIDIQFIVSLTVIISSDSNIISHLR